jgi:hypothetical protein
MYLVYPIYSTSRSIEKLLVKLLGFLEKGEIGVNPPNPLRKGAKIRILVPLEKGDLGGFRSRNEVYPTSVYAVAAANALGWGG